MKAIIDGKMYDTEKAECLGMTSIFHKLYITQNGRFFLVNEDKQKIVSADHQAIMKRIGEVAPDMYIELFGEVEEA